MNKLKSFVTSLHQSTSRNYLQRMVDDKPHCMGVASQYGHEYWDGDRRYGYGGYSFLPGRWKPVAESLINHYRLDNSSSIIDIGCGKGFLLHELKLLLPGLKVIGLDISEHGIEHSTDTIRPHLKIHDCRQKLPFEDKMFDLAISLGTLHNFKLRELRTAIAEINRIAVRKYIMVESYRTDVELFNLQCWALTAKSFLDPDDWQWIFAQCSYDGDHEFIYFE